MIHQTAAADPDKLHELDALRRELAGRSGTGGPIIQRLRRHARTHAFTSSTSIEGYQAPDNAMAITNREAPGAIDDQDQAALHCYSLAMHHVQVMAQDPHFRWSDRVLLDLHFEACSFQNDKSPGLWRTGPMFVTRPGGAPPYRAPEPQHIPALMAEVVDWIEQATSTPPVVRAAMMHLHLVSVHPFHDGNGRLARIAQSLVLARSGPLPPELGSIEPALARSTLDYYTALAQVQGNFYDPTRDATTWVDFCVEAHLVEAQSRLEQINQASDRWQTLELVVQQAGWPERLVIGLELSLFEPFSRAKYAMDAQVSPATASADLRRLVDAGWLQAQGKGPAVRYRATEGLKDRTLNPT